jgi:Rap1a immunity proteins
MFRRLALAMLVVGIPFTAHAVTGQELLNYCTEFVRKQGTREGFDNLNAGFCIGFMHGVLDTMDLNSQTAAGRRNFCFSENAKIDQAIRVVEKHLRENPSMLHFSAVSQASLALSRAFPCR